jgi:hypothetical protein
MSRNNAHPDVSAHAVYEDQGSIPAPGEIRTMSDELDPHRKTRVERRTSRWASVAPRGMTKEEAAEYCGCETKGAFDSWIQKGIVPGPIPGTQRWDRKAIDLWLDRASDIKSPAEPVSAWDEWKAMKARDG